MRAEIEDLKTTCGQLRMRALPSVGSGADAPPDTAARRASPLVRGSARIFQLMKCSACSNPLDLPATHFLCMHSFHQRCLGDNERECPMCAPANRTILEIKRSQEANAQRHDQFYKQLEVADDGFSVVADYFGRNVFNKIVLLDGAGVAGPSRSAR